MSLGDSDAKQRYRILTEQVCKTHGCVYFIVFVLLHTNHIEHDLGDVWLSKVVEERNLDEHLLELSAFVFYKWLFTRLLLVIAEILVFELTLPSRSILLGVLNSQSKKGALDCRCLFLYYITVHLVKCD